MGLANVDPGFVSGAGLAPSQRCVFSGVPAAPQLPSAKRFVRRYRKVFKREPGVWGVFTYDSARILFRAIEKAGGTGFARVQKRLKHTKGYRGQTGTTTIDPATGYRAEAALPEHPERGRHEELRDRAVARRRPWPCMDRAPEVLGARPCSERTCHRRPQTAHRPVGSFLYLYRRRCRSPLGTPDARP